MDFPNNKVGVLTAKIMFEINKHLKIEPNPQAIYHYNRVYEKIYSILEENLEEKKTNVKNPKG